MSKQIIQFNEEIIKVELKELVRNSVEETLNSLLDQEAKNLTKAAKYERTESREGYRSGHYNRNLATTSGEVTLKVPKLKGIPFETAIIERYRRREGSVGHDLPKRVRKQITTLDVDQMLRFKKCMEEYRVPNTQLKNSHHPLYPAFLLMLTTGCRRGEILGLTWENVHLDEGYVSIRQHLIVTSKGLMLETPKTNNSIRDIPLTDKVIDVLRDYKEDKTGLVFTTYKGNYIHPRTFDRS